jgi:restriction system protein
VDTLRTTLADLTRRRNEERDALSQIERNMAAAIENQRQLTDQLAEYRQSRLYRLGQLAAENWKAMRGGELEAFLERVFAELQYSVERTGQAGDQGVDLIVAKDGHRIAVQVKGYVDSVPNTAIQEAFTGMAFYRCDACAVITNSRFTSGGRSIAGSVGCALIDEYRLPALIMGQIDLWEEALAARARRGSTGGGVS